MLDVLATLLYLRPSFHLMASHIVEKIIYLSLLDWTIRINFAFVAERISATLACQEILTIYFIVVLSGIVAIVTSC